MAAAVVKLDGFMKKALTPPDSNSENASDSKTVREPHGAGRITLQKTRISVSVGAGMEKMDLIPLQSL